MDIANQGFPATRADLNNALQAIATNNSGTSAPSTTFANQWFYNTSTNKLFIRNEANNAYIEVATLDQTNNEWQITTGVIQAKDGDGLALKTDDGTTRLFIADADGAITMGSATLSTDGNEDTLVLKSNDADANAGPKLQFNRNSASAADADLIGEMRYSGRNDASQAVDYARIRSQISDASDGTEDGQLQIATIVAGTMRRRVDFDATETVFNDASVDLDFRVESDNNANALFVQGSDGNIGIGIAAPLRQLHINNTSANSEIAFTAATNGVSSILFGDGQTGTDVYRGYLQYNHTDDAMLFASGATERMRISSSGDVLIAKTTTTSSAAGIRFTSGGSVELVRNGGQLLYVNRLTSDGTLISLAQGNSTEGTITVSGSTVSYNGGHLSRWSRLTSGNKDTSIVKGTVMTNLDEMVVWSHDAVEAKDAKDAVFDDDGNIVTEAVDAVEAQDAWTEDNEQLNCMAISSVEGDPNVAGVFVNWDNDDDFNDMNVGMTGDMVIRIAKGTTVARGDLLMSAGDGTAKPQGDDIVRSKTIAKVTSTNVSHTYDDESYLVPCVLMAC